MLALITTSEASQLVQNFTWHTPSWDLFIILFWGLSAVLYAFAAGRGRILSLLMSLYIAKLLVLEAPWITQKVNEQLSGTLIGLQQMVSFLLIFITLFMLLSRFAFKTSADGRHLASVPFALVFAVLQIGLLIQTILSYLAQSGKEFSNLVSTIFLSNGAAFAWLLAPLLFLIFLGHFISDRSEAWFMKYTLLLVDDDPLILNTLQKRFESWQIDVFSAKTPEEAKIIMEKSVPDVLVLDLLLTTEDGSASIMDFMAGKPELEKVPIIILTNLDKPDVKQALLDKGVKEYLIKGSMSLDDIYDRIMFYLKPKA